MGPRLGLPLPTAPTAGPVHTLNPPHLPEPLDDVGAEQRASQPLQQVEQRQDARIHVEAPPCWGVGDREVLPLPPPFIPSVSPETPLGPQEDSLPGTHGSRGKESTPHPPGTQPYPRATHQLLTRQGDALLQRGLGEHDHQRVDLW